MRDVPTHVPSVGEVRREELHLDGLSVDLGGRRVLDDISLALGAGEFVALVGPNGAGKTTLLRAIAGLIASAGMVRINSEPLAGLSLRKRARRMSYMPQNGTLAWSMRVRDVVAIGRLPHEGRRHGEQDARIIDAAMQACGVDHLATRMSDQLSGGEKVRVMLARALAVEAPILLFDEPVASLDPSQQLAVMDLLRAQAEAGRIVIVVLHDLALAVRYASRALVLCDGRILADGSPADLLRNGKLGKAFDLTLDWAQTASGLSLHASRSADAPAARASLPDGGVAAKTG